MFVICFLFISTNANAFDEWTKQDITLQAVYTVLHVVDWGQTLDIANNPKQYFEEYRKRNSEKNKPYYRAYSFLKR